MGDLTKKKYYKEISEWQEIYNLFLSHLYVERTYDDMAELTGYSRDRVKKILTKMYKEGKVRRVEVPAAKGMKAAYIMVLEK